MERPDEKEIPIERVILFSDAVVAIAITLLALDLRLEVEEGHVLSFCFSKYPFSLAAPGTLQG